MRLVTLCQTSSRHNADMRRYHDLIGVIGVGDFSKSETGSIPRLMHYPSAKLSHRHPQHA